MIDKNAVRDFILKECDYCLHLYTKIPEGGLDYRPTEGQRSTLELLRYLSFCAIGSTHTLLDGNWDKYRELAEAAESMTGDEFPAAMERQKQMLTAIFDEFTDEDATTRTAQNPLGAEFPLLHGLINMPHNWLVGYRMQLFLYVKQAGNNDVWTPDCWAGVSMDRPTAAPAESS